MTIKNVWKYLPFGSLINADTINHKQLLGHITYGTVFAGLVTYFLTMGFSTNSWSPIEQKKIAFEKLAKEWKEIHEFDRYYQGLEQTVFGPEGLADTDFSGDISPRERLEAYERMDLDSITVSPGSGVTARNLEKGIQSYEGLPDSIKGFN